MIFFSAFFFGDPYSSCTTTSSLGSAVVLSTDGFDFNQHHVINDADEIIVRFSDRKPSW